MSFSRLFGFFYLCTLLFLPACAPEAPSAASQKAAVAEAEVAAPVASRPAEAAQEKKEKEPVAADQESPDLQVKETAAALAGPGSRGMSRRLFLL